MLKRLNLKLIVVIWIVGLVLAGCNFAVQTPTPEPTATLTPSVTPTSTASPTPTITPSPTIELTATPTLTPTDTLTPTMIPSPTATAYPTAGFTNDQWKSIDVPPSVQNGLDSPWFAFVSANERTDTSNLRTPLPSVDQETVYLVNPATGEQVTILDLPSSTDDRVYWAPDGNKVVYFMEPGLLSDGTEVGGLYLLNLSVGISLRLFNIPSLSPRGLTDHRPVWSPDSSQLAIVLPTEYAVDIYSVAADGSSFKNLTSSGSYDMWPAWSPDGKRLAFVSDRQTCPTWAPGTPDSCATLDAVPPTSGNLYVMDVETQEVREISEVELDGPPAWVSNLQVGFTTGLSDPFAAESEIWLANTQSGTVREISDEDGSLNLEAAWSPGGLQVLYHRASDPPAVILKDSSGNVISSLDQYAFSRFGFAAAWSPKGDYVAFAGRNGQCPYGVIVARNDLSIVYGPATMPRACDPSYSPDGVWLAYSGITYRPGVDDGRLDLYIGQANGYSSRSVTSRLRGQISPLGWVGPAGS